MIYSGVILIMKFVMQSGVLVEQQWPDFSINFNPSAYLEKAADSLWSWLGDTGLPFIADGFAVGAVFFILMGVLGFKSGFNKAFKCGIVSLILTVIGGALIG